MNKSTAILAILLLASCASAAVKTAADYDVGDYVQDGLVAHYDAIRNAGANLPHDANPAQWVDLASNGVYATLVNVPNKGDYNRGYWTTKAFHFAGFSCMQMSAPLTLGANFTIQAVLDADLDSERAVAEGRLYPNIFAAADATLTITMNRSWATPVGKTNIYWQTDKYSSAGNSNGRPTLDPFHGKYVNAAFDSGLARSLLSETASFTKSGKYVYKPNSADASVETLTYSWGGRPGVSDASRGFAGDYHALRIYTRKLSDDELAWNMAVDECRFREGPIPSTNVIVEASSYAGVAGVEPPGVYTVVGSHTFTAPDVTIGDVTYSAVGHTIETWTGSYWASAARFDGNSYTYVVADNASIVRLTWLWKPVRGIINESGWDANGYVQGGLVAQYDGIRNAGADLPHDATAIVWRDLKSSNCLTFNGTNAEAAATGSWTDGNAYLFAGYSYARMADPLSMGSNITVQLAVDIDNAAQVAAYEADSARLRTPQYFAAGTDYGVFANIYSSTQRRYVQWKNDIWTGSGTSTRAAYNGWNLKYLTGMTTDDKGYLFDDTEFDATMAGKRILTRTKFLPFTDIRWTVGGSHFDSSATSDANINSRLSIGKYHSVRFYNRPLTNEELAWNRKVDEIRFRGVVYTNVVVASSKAEAQGVQPNGVYEVITEGTFTAAPIPALKDGAHFIYVPTGFTVERLVNGVWSAPEAHAGASYTYNVQNENGAIVRLTWKWRADGLGFFMYLK